MGIMLGFVANLKGRGLWIGIVAGSIVQTILLSLFAIFTNWKKQVGSHVFLSLSFFFKLSIMVGLALSDKCSYMWVLLQVAKAKERIGRSSMGN